MRMYDPECSCDDMKEQLDVLANVVDNLEDCIKELENLDKRFFDEEISDIKNLLSYFESEAEELEDDLNIKESEEYKKYREELQCMNHEFERSKL